ncbi:MAG TPA: hypothetical protein VHN37_11260 [Actinomycetota bacterium]|nr:hypothetical protein [Actinomycetota bacterium]
MAAALVPSPARAATVCQTLLKSTPTVVADIDGDGRPDAKVPSIFDVTLCTTAEAAYVTYPPRTENCSAGWHPTCMAVYVTVAPADADADARADLCYTIEGSSRTCHVVMDGDHVGLERRTMCIGYDLNGGHPCSGGTYAVVLQ